MSNTLDKKGLAAVAVVTGLSATVAVAQDNPFALKDLSAGYVQVAEQKEMTCGEGKCGGSMMKSGQPAKDMSGMQGMQKGMEGKCAANMQQGSGSTTPPADNKGAAPMGSMKH
jgi:uncharacterized low-complexity protein